MKKNFTLPQLLELQPALENLRFCPLISDATSTSISRNMKAVKAAIDAHQPLVQAVYDRYQDLVAEEQADIPEAARTMTNLQVANMQREANAVALELLEVDITFLKRSDFPKNPKEFGMRKRTITGQDGTQKVIEGNYYENFVILRDELILSDEEFKALGKKEPKAKMVVAE